MLSPPAAGDQDEQRIGSALQAVTTELLDCGGQLRSLLHGQLASTATEPLGRLLTELEKQVCGVAVIGQVKAGKSSFINALTNRPGLLPTDVNPWTAVVTRLHFNRPGGPADGALFQFFSEDEWQNLAEGGGKLRELTERLVPGFKHDTLRRQFDTMRQLAELKFGKQFRHLLGKAHEFPTVTPEILERYVCASSQATGREATTGRFSDITKSADLYFNVEPFGHPTTVLDTPGTNDPFLIRDEITRRNLEHADVYVVVLTAQQALSTADLALLRILHGLNKDRIIVFINRIDQLKDIVRDSREIVGHVQRVLQREFPNVSIPVVAGSALWGQSASDVDRADLASLLGPTLNAYGRHAGVLKDEDVTLWRASEAPDRARIRRTLQLCSGIPTIASLMSEMMLKGPGANYVKLVAACLIGVAETLETSARSEINALTASAKAARGEGLSPEETAQIRADLDRMPGLAKQIEHYSQQTREEFQRLRDDGLIGLREVLENAVISFAKSEAHALFAALHEQTLERVWQTDTLPLRRAMEEEFRDVFDQIREELVGLQQDVAVHLRELLNNAVPEGRVDSGAATIPVSDPNPSLAALSETVALDLDPHWWMLWWRQKRAPDDKARELYRLIRTEFAPVVDGLVASAQKELNDHISDVIRRFLTMSLGVVRAVHERQKHLAEALNPSEIDRTSEAFQTKLREQEQQLAQSKEALAKSEALLKRLRELFERHAIVAPPAPADAPPAKERAAT